jgi:ABC-type glutathione transport system ATPase component
VGDDAFGSYFREQLSREGCVATDGSLVELAGLRVSSYEITSPKRKPTRGELPRTSAENARAERMVSVAPAEPSMVAVHASAPATDGPGDRFEWRDLSVDIGGRTVVQPQSGFALPGELLVILGPSGAGKTTLLSVLCGDRRPSSGTVLFQGNVIASAGAPVIASVRRRALREIGYVRQRDIFMEALTVEETLMFTARLRMARSLSRDQKRAHVRQLIADLGLSACAATTIGSAMRRYVITNVHMFICKGLGLASDCPGSTADLSAATPYA